MAASMLQRHVQSSELSRNSASVFAAAEEGPVTITRRDGEDFILATVTDATRERRAIEIASGLVAASLSESSASLGDRLREPFPWVEFLTETDREAFADEIIRVMRACAALGEFRPLLIAFSAWKSTAEAYARGITPDDQLDWLDTPLSVGRPTMD